MITSNQLARLFPFTPRRKRDRFLPALNKYLPKYKINTAKRVRAFLATFGIETDYAKTTVEYASGAAYEGRRDLGNVVKGDGMKYKGRGGFQTTGRFNYERVNERCSKKLGIDFIKNPERLAEIDVAIESACIFWEENKLSAYADTGHFFAVSGVVNRGNPNEQALHYDKRLQLYRLCEKVIPADFTFISCETVPPSPSENKPAEAAATASTSVKDFTKKYLVHTPTDSVKNIFFVVTARVASAATALWNFGFTGKALLFLIIFAAIVPVVIAVVYYRPRIWNWGMQIWDGFFGE
jgi:predicted chitinase